MICSPSLLEEELVSIAKSVEKYETCIKQENLELDENGYYGLAGVMAKEIAAINGTSKEAILFQLLVCISVLCAQKFYYSIGGKKMYASDYLVLVGVTGASKKGTSFSDVKYFFDKFFPEFSSQRLKTGVNSGEGLVNCIRDRIVSLEKDEKGRDEEVVKDEGALTKIVLFLETEFSRLLKAGKRDGSTVTDTYRNAWDGVPLEINTSQRSIRSTDYCVSLIAHITPRELKSLVTDIDSSNGYLNRFMFCLATGGEPRPFPESFERVNFSFIESFKECVSFINSTEIQEIQLCKEAKGFYEQVYIEFFYKPEDKITELISRNTQHLLKMAMIFAVLDKSFLINENHLKAAKAMIDFSSNSIKELFWTNDLNKKEKKVLSFLKNKNKGCTRSIIQSECFKNNASKDELDLIQKSLEKMNLIKVTFHDGATHWSL